MTDPNFDKTQAAQHFESEHIGETVFSTEEIEQGVQRVANALNKNYDEAVLVTVVPGGILFAADLVRKLRFCVELDTLSCPHIPGERQNRSAINYAQNIDVREKHVILLDDAIESGGTMLRLIEYFKNNTDCRSVAIASLFVKSGRVNLDAPQYFAYELHFDSILIGYGLPWQDKFRNLPFVAKLRG